MQDLISVIVPVYKMMVHRMDVRQSVMNMPERTGESG